MAQQDDSHNERAPLLQNGSHRDELAARIGDSEQQVREDGGQENESDPNEAIIEEPSTSRKIAIMSSLWVGVFFAALGMSYVLTYIDV